MPIVSKQQYDFLKAHAIELKVAHPEMLKAITAAKKNDRADLEFADRCFNLRSSNTELLLRLNVESRGDRELMAWESWGDSYSVPLVKDDLDTAFSQTC